MKGYSLWDQSILTQAVAHSEASGDLFARAFTVEMYAHYLGSNGKYEKALTHFGQLIDMMSTEGANYEQAMNMSSGGRCYCARAGKLDEALRYAAEAREIGEAMGDARLVAWCAMEAEPYMYKGLWEQVIRVAEEVQPVARKIGEWSVILWISAWLGIAYLKVGRLEDARRVIDRAQKESQSSASSRVAITYLQIAAAQLHLAIGEPDKALGAARKALQLAESSRLRLEHGADAL